jgi:hypothetical protein
MEFKQCVLVGAVSAMALLSGCGSSGSNSDSKIDSAGAGAGIGYSGSTSEAVISVDNSNDLAGSGVVVTKSLTQTNDVKLPIGITVSGSLPVAVQDKLNKILTSHRAPKTASNLPVGITETESGDCGGSIISSGSETGYKTTFNDFCEDGSITNGTISGSFSDSTETMSFNEFSVFDDGETFVMSGTITSKRTSTQYIDSGDVKVIIGDEAFEYSYTETCTISTRECIYSENIQADNGQSYRIEEKSVNEGSNGWDVTATLYDPTYGYVEYVADNIQYCTDGSGNIESGSITLTDDDTNVLRIDFNDCTDMTITFGGNAEILAQ